MKTELPNSITNELQAKQFLKELYINGESFHPEDNAHDIIGNLFTFAEGEKLNVLMDQIFLLKSFDPCEYILSLDPERNKIED